MYKCHLRQMSLFENPEYFVGIKLNKNNEWIKLAKLIPWHEFEDEYADQFSGTAGQPACSVKEALGTLIIKERYRFSDEATVAHIVMNPYLQYFIGFEESTAEPPFDTSMFTRFRKRITPEMLQRVNDVIIGRPGQKEDAKDPENDNHDDH